MKKLFSIAIMLLCCVTTASATTTSLQEVVDFGALLMTFPLYVAVILPITGWLKNAINVEDNQAKWLSWVIAVIVAILAWALGLGFFADIVWWHAAIIGVVGGLTANGLFNTTIGQAIIGLLKAK